VKLVVDASVALKWILRDDSVEQHLAQAEDLLTACDDGKVELLAPIHWQLEINSVVARLQPLLLEPTIKLLGDLAPTTVNSADSIRLAARISIQTSTHMFDSLYHAIALQSGATLVTADERYYGKAQSLGAILLLPDLSL
jgi:predicted nucleic acid-binding protein